MKKVLMLCAVVAFALGCTKSGLEVSNNKSLQVSCNFASFDGLDGFEKSKDQTSSEKSKDSVSPASFDKSKSPADSRLTDTAFEVEDEIGIYVHTDLAVQNPPSGNHSSNLRYIFKDDNTWQSASALGGDLIQSAYNATGYYPYKGTITNPHAVAHSVESDQSTHVAMSRSDFARAVSALVNPNSEAPTLNFSGEQSSFKHLMSKLRVSAFIPTEVDGVVVESIASVVIGGLKNGCTVNLADGVVTLNTSAVATEIVAREVVKGGAGRYSEWEAIVVPQSVAVGVDLVTITLNMTGGSTKELKYTIESGEAFSDLKSGTRVTLTLGNSADLAFANVSELDIVDGLAKAGQFSVKAPSGTAWSVASSQTWLTLTNRKTATATGAGTGSPQEVTFAIALNSTEKIRTAILTLSATINGRAESTTHTITQNYYVLGVASSMNIDAKVLSTPMAPFTSNQVWTATITATDGGAAPDWLKLSTSATAGTTPLLTYTHTGNLAANKLFYHTTINEGDGRSAKIVFSNSITPNLAEQLVTQSADGPDPTTEGVLIGNLYWATGNLVADGANGNECKIGAPTDYGLYFQFGGLVGWSGGNGTGAGTGSPTLAIKVKPASCPSTVWNDNYQGQGSKITGVGVFNYSTAPYSTANTDIRGFDEPITGITAAGNLGSGKYASIGVGDPCTYYLGSKWRTPSRAEYYSMFGGGAFNIPARSWSWYGGNSIRNSSTSLRFPASGRRDYSNGSFLLVGTYGYYWSSSVYYADGGYSLHFNSGDVSPEDADYRSYGFPVRCVSPPPPPPPIPDGVWDSNSQLHWATGNMLASGNAIGSDTDYGGYWTFDQAKTKCQGLGGNWRLPTSAEFVALFGSSTTWGSSNFNWSASAKAAVRRASPSLSFPAAGLNGGYAAGSSGGYWSSTESTSDHGFHLYFHAASVSPQGNGNKTSNRSVRCVSSPPPALTLSKSSPGETVPGDGKVYTIGVTSNTSWSAKNLSGVTVSPSSGSSGTTSVTITVAANLLGTTRTVKCDFSTTNSDGQTNLTKTWSGTQAAIPPPATRPVVIDGLTWATGNMLASGSTMGSPDDRGGYWNFNEAKSQCSRLGAGWRLPTREDFIKLFGGSGDFNPSASPARGWTWYKPSGKDGFIQHDATGLRFPAAGYNGGSSAGSNGNYWSSTENSSNNGYNLYFSAYGVYPQYNDTKTLNYSVRCVYSPPPANSVWDSKSSLYWATGNLLASGNAIGSDTEYGGYWTWHTAPAACLALGGKWRLPTKDEFVALFNGYTGGSSWSSTGGFSFTSSSAYKSSLPLRFPAAGYNGGSDAGTYGHYWSSTENNSDNGYYLRFGANYVYPQHYDYKTSTRSVRCVSE